MRRPRASQRVPPRPPAPPRWADPEWAAVRRAEEALTVQMQDLDWTLTRLAPVRSVQAARVRHAIVLARTATVVDPARIAAYQRHADALIVRLGLTVSWTAMPGTNAYAWTHARHVEAAPITCDLEYASFLHECGHMASEPCRHATAQAASAGRRACVPCELLAWRWATREAIAWTRAMHDILAVSLQSYAWRATASERREIDAVSSDQGFRVLRHQRVVATEHAYQMARLRSQIPCPVPTPSSTAARSSASPTRRMAS